MDTKQGISDETADGLQFPCDILLWRDTLTLGELRDLSREKRLELPRGFRGSGALRSGGVIIAWGVVEQGEGGLSFRVEDLVPPHGGDPGAHPIGGGYQIT